MIAAAVQSIGAGSARARYAEQRRVARESLETREERGLPHHPINALLPCPDCEGHGSSVEIVGRGNPEEDIEHSCERCYGRGALQDGRIDPLATLRQARALRRLGGDYRYRYEMARRAAMRPVSGLACAAMRAMATRCVTASESAVQAWRAAA